jgi:septum formation inhibitor MinC
MRLRGRSYMAFALAPEPPIADWLTELDNWLRASPDFFAIRPVVLDLSGVTLTTPAISHLISELAGRQIRIMGIEGVEAEKITPALPPLMRGGKAAPLEAIEGKRSDNNNTVAVASPSTKETASLVPERRHHRDRLGRIGSRGRGRRVDPHLRHVAGAGHGGHFGQPQRPHLLQSHGG